MHIHFSVVLEADAQFSPAKCVQRKLRCTYVKFHRQTAPVGPGHKPAGLVQAPGSVTAATSNLGPAPPTTTSSSSSRYPIYSEDFLLSSSSATSAPSGVAASSYGAPQHQAQAAIHEALYPQSATASTFPFGSLYSSSPSSTGSATADVEYSARRGAHQEDLYRSSSLPPGSNATYGWPSQQQQQDSYHHHAHSQQTVERHAYSAHQQPHTLAPHQQHGNTFIYYQ